MNAQIEAAWQHFEGAYRVNTVPMLGKPMVDDMMSKLKPIFFRIWRPTLAERIPLPADPIEAAAASAAIQQAEALLAEYTVAVGMELLTLLATAYTEKWSKALPESPQTRQ